MGTKDHRRYQAEAAELRFHALALEQGLLVSKPSVSTRYDFILDNGKRLDRVQVKATYSKNPSHTAYSLLIRPRARSYTADQIDFLVAYVAPEDTWYIVPVTALAQTKHMLVFPQNEASRGRYERFREAWHLLAA